MDILSSSIDYLKGVGPTRADLLKKELRIFTYGDLLFHYTFMYIDRSKIHNVSELTYDMPYVQIKGVVTKLEEKGKKRAKRLIAYFKDETGIIELVWFKGARWIKSSIQINKEYIVFGKPTVFSNKLNIAHPEIDIVEQKEISSSTLQGVYNSTEKLNAKGLSSRAISKLVRTLLPLLKNHIQETLSATLIKNLNLPTREEALYDIHNPIDRRALIRAQKRLKFEEFFFLQLHLLKMKLGRVHRCKGYRLSDIGDGFNDFYKKIVRS